MMIFVFFRHRWAELCLRRPFDQRLRPVPRKPVIILHCGRSNEPCRQLCYFRCPLRLHSHRNRSITSLPFRWWCMPIGDWKRSLSTMCDRFCSGTLCRSWLMVHWFYFRPQHWPVCAISFTMTLALARPFVNCGLLRLPKARRADRDANVLLLNIFGQTKWSVYYYAENLNNKFKISNLWWFS